VSNGKTIKPKMISPWRQSYLLWGQSLGVSALIAAIPILVLLLLLAVLRRPAWQAGLCGFAATFVLAITAYGMSITHAISSAAYGAAFGIFPISWIVYWAIVLYRITVETGKFEVIKESVGAITSDMRLQVLLIAFAFGAFLEGGSGFGTPVAVAAAMMTGLGFSPWYASAICLLANTVPVAFGSIGIPVITLAGITGIPVDMLSAEVGRICAPISFFVPAYLIAATSGRAAVREIWPAVLVCGGTFAGMQFLISNFVGAQLTDILSSLSAMGGLVLLLRFWHPKTTLRVQENQVHENQGPARSLKAREIVIAWIPYILLVCFVLTWGYKPVQQILNAATTVFHWPWLHNEIQRMPPVVVKPAAYGAIYNFNWLSAAGTSCMFAALLSAVFLRMKFGALLSLLISVARQLFLPTVTVAAVLAMAFVMNYCGATGTLGLAFAATGALFPFFSSFLGWLGVFLTGSDTSANALFGSLQVVTAERLGFNPTLMAASNSAGGVMGKMISLQTIAVAAAATGLSVREQAKLFRFTLRHSVFLAAVIGIEVMLYAYVFRPK
jgi:L-lactate transport